MTIIGLILGALGGGLVAGIVGGVIFFYLLCRGHSGNGTGVGAGILAFGMTLLAAICGAVTGGFYGVTLTGGDSVTAVVGALIVLVLIVVAVKWPRKKKETP